MRILAITQHIGKTAPGRVFESFLRSLSNVAEVSVICTDCHPSYPLSTINRLPFSVNILEERFMRRIDKIALTIGSISVTDWLHKQATKPYNLPEFDVLLSLCSALNMAPLCMGAKIKRIFDVPWVCYLVDACPTPSWWNSGRDQKGVARYLRKYSRELDGFISSNPIMLEYQKKFLAPNIKFFDVIYPVVTSEKNEVNVSRQTGSPKFLFAGSIYGLRRPTHLFKAFEKLLNIYPQSELIFVGTSTNIRTMMPDSIAANVKILPFSRDLTSFYSSATALIDIDADVEFDVFLSSKSTAYIDVDRPIICETGKDTPARNLFTGIDSILLCSHDADEIYNAMVKSISSSFNYKDRDGIKRLFDYSLICNNLVSYLESIVN